MAQRTSLELLLRLRKDGKGAKAVAADLRALKKEGKDTAAVMDELTGASTKAGLALTALGVAGGVFIGSATKLAARVETLGVVTARLGENVGMTEEEVRKLEESIQDQGITIRSTREAVAKMIQAQVDLSHATDLARLAQNAAVIGNINSSEAYTTLINVIATGNVRMARRLGLQVRFQKALEKEAERLGKTVDELEDYEVTQARTNAVLEAGVGIQGAYEAAMDTAGKQLLSLDRHFEESRRIIGETYLPILASLVTTVTDALKGFQALNVGQQRGIATAMGMGAAWSSLLGVGLLLLPQLMAVKGALVALNIAAGGMLGPIGLVVGLIAALSTAMIAQSAANKANKDEMLDLAKAYGHVQDSELKLLEITQKTTDEVDQGALTYSRYERAMKKLSDQLDLTIISQEQLNHLIEIGSPQAKRFSQGIILMSEAEWNLTQMMERERQEMLLAADSRRILAEKTEDAAEETEKAAAVTRTWEDAQRDFNRTLQGTVQTTGTMLDQLDTGLSSSIGKFMDDLEFLSAGGLEIQLAFEKIRDAVRDDVLTPEEAAPLLEGLFVASQELQVDLGNLTANEAARNISEQLGTTWQESHTALDEIDEKLTGLERTIEVWIDVRTKGKALAALEALGIVDIVPPPAAPPSTGINSEFAEFGQKGMDMIVPPGFNKDNFPIGVSSGERVIVQTKEQQAQGEPAERVRIDQVNINNLMTLRAFGNMMERWAGL